MAEHLLENARQKMIMASLNQSTNPSARRIALLLAGVATAAGVAGSILLKNDTDEVTNLVPSHIHSNSRRQFTLTVFLSGATRDGDDWRDIPNLPRHIHRVS